MPPTSIDGTDISGATIDGTEVTEITADGNVVFSARPEMVDAYIFDGEDGNGGLNQFDMTGNPGDLSSATKTTGVISLNRQQGFSINPDGTRIYMDDSSELAQWDLSTAYDLTTAGNKQNSGIGQSFRAVVFNTDGTKVFTSGFTDNISSYSLSTGFDVTTANSSAVNTFSISNDVTGLTWNDDGTRLIASGYSPGRLIQYDLSTPFDISTMTQVAEDENLGRSLGVTTNYDGTKLYYQHNGSNMIEFELSTPFDITTKSQTATRSIGDWDGTTISVPSQYYR